MNEHDDDLESTVHEDAEEETDTYPETADELDEVIDESQEDEEKPRLDADEAEV